MKKLNIYLCLNSVKHLKDKSYYNRNYYEFEPYGDWCIFFNGNNIVEEICHEDEDYCSYTLGHFDGDEGSLYMTFPDEELKQIFLTAIEVYEKNKINKTTSAKTALAF